MIYGLNLPRDGILETMHVLEAQLCATVEL